MVLRIPVILGTVREGRQSEHLARFVHGRLSARQGTESPFVDPARQRFDNLRRRAVDVEQANTPEVLDFVKLMHSCDGFVIVTPEYNFSFPGALKNLLDVTFKPWNRKPFALIGCGGQSGGMRAVDSLRQVISGIGAITIPAHLTVQGIEKTFNAQGPVADVPDWTRRVDKVLDDLEWYAWALKQAREASANA